MYGSPETKRKSTMDGGNEVMSGPRLLTEGAEPSGRLPAHDPRR